MRSVSRFGWPPTDPVAVPNRAPAQLPVGPGLVVVEVDFINVTIATKPDVEVLFVDVDDQEHRINGPHAQKYFTGRVKRIYVTDSGVDGGFFPGRMASFKDTTVKLTGPTRAGVTVQSPT